MHSDHDERNLRWKADGKFPQIQMNQQSSLQCLVGLPRLKVQTVPFCVFAINVYKIGLPFTPVHKNVVGNVSGYRGSTADPGVASLTPARSHTFAEIVHEIISTVILHHSPPFCLIIQEWLLSVTSESMCMKYWLTTCSSLPRKKCG